MPSPYTVAKTKHATLVANTVDQVTITGGYELVEIVNRSQVDTLWCRIGSPAAPVDPTVAGDDTTVVRPGDSLKVGGGRSGDPTIVKLISAGTPAYSVCGAR